MPVDNLGFDLCSFFLGACHGESAGFGVHMMETRRLAGVVYVRVQSRCSGVSESLANCQHNAEVGISIQLTGQVVILSTLQEFPKP